MRAQPCRRVGVADVPDSACPLAEAARRSELALSACVRALLDRIDARSPEMLALLPRPAPSLVDALLEVRVDDTYLIKDRLRA
jgi:hypothetical protein